MEVRRTSHVSYSFSERELALKLGIPVTPQEWVVVKIDNGTVYVTVRTEVPSGTS